LSRIDELTELSLRLVQAAKDIKILTALSWQQNAADDFLTSFRNGDPQLPVASRPAHLPEKEATLAAIEASCDLQDPCGKFIAETAHSYGLAAKLIQNQGTPEFHRISTELFGGASGQLAGSALNHREAAAQLLDTTSALSVSIDPNEYALCITAQGVAHDLETEWQDFFDTPMNIVIDPTLSSKAAASADRVRLRAGTCFTRQDAAQLSAHEIGVHSLTARNGRSQPILSVLGLGSPRTTATQEGLATFAELITGAIDLARLRRLAVRILAIGHAEDGADFIEVFRFLLDLGEAQDEAVHTTMRIFRGGDVRGRYVFTKDVSYLKGLFAVHTYLRKAISENRPESVHRLFVGRLALRDIASLEAEFGEVIEAPRFLPTWATNMPCLAAFLAFSALMNQIDLREAEVA
tara:strand:+ start:17624 stop:18847 length:1224 start_codon:yes stop_codon:yes gene_type:complete